MDIDYTVAGFDTEVIVIRTTNEHFRSVLVYIDEWFSKQDRWSVNSAQIVRDEHRGGYRVILVAD